MKILFMSHWYPNRYDKMFGLFVQKHAEAVSIYCDVAVLYVHADENIKDFELIKQKINKVTEYVIYYPINKKRFFYPFTKLINYAKAYKIGFRKLKKDGFNFDLIHSNILTRTPTVAYLYSLFNRTPYIITEHWSRYLPERNQFNGFFRKMVARIVVKNAKAVFPVSENLKKHMLEHKLYNNNYLIVNNVVDDFFLERSTPEIRNKKRIIHISCFDEKAKNTKGLLRAVKQVGSERDDFNFQMIGSGIDLNETIQYCKEINVSDIVEFLGELSPKEVAKRLMNADFFCLFSNYENVPVVISESLTCGKPVIATNVGGISEHVNETNGILINPQDEKTLVDALNYMLDHFHEYDAEKISKKAYEMYSFENVGKYLVNIYKSVL